MHFDMTNVFMLLYGNIHNETENVVILGDINLFIDIILEKYLSWLWLAEFSNFPDMHRQIYVLKLHTFIFQISTIRDDINLLRPSDTSLDYLNQCWIGIDWTHVAPFTNTV